MHWNQSKFVQVNNHRLAYHEVGPHTPHGAILLLTGLGSTRHGWYRQIKPFGDIYRTIALDHRDAGDSDRAADYYRVVDQAADAAALLSQIGIGRSHVVGISMGGYVALELALHHPEVVDKLVLVSTSAGGAGWLGPHPTLTDRLIRYSRLSGDETVRQSYAAIVAPGHFDRHPDDWELIAGSLGGQPMHPDSYFRQLHACLLHDTVHRLRTIKQPTLVVHGDIDPLIPPENGRYLAAKIPGARLIMYPQTGHLPIIERADEFNKDVLAFLGGG